MASQPQISDGEVWATRFNVGLARSQRVISSWLSQPITTTAAEDSSDEDFKAADERAPIGAKPKDSDLPESVRRSRASNDKLLEQIIGKKAAQAKRKLDASKTKPVVKLVPQIREESDSEEEEAGRAATFSSRKRARDASKPASVAIGGETDGPLGRNDEPPDPQDDPAAANEMVRESSDEQERPKKRKGGSYLDEVLAKKAKKSKKKKKKEALAAV